MIFFAFSLNAISVPGSPARRPPTMMLLNTRAEKSQNTL